MNEWMNLERDKRKISNILNTLLVASYYKMWVQFTSLYSL
jgi:hypothetical protein